jgi:serine phosphatase RsbU (regulator of sigma subunit)
LVSVSSMRILFSIILSVLTCSLFAQNKYVDSLNKVFLSSPDTSKVIILVKLATHYETNNSSLAYKLADSGSVIAKRIGFTKGLGLCYARMGSCLTTRGKYDESIDYAHRAIKIFESIKDRRATINTLNNLANTYTAINKDKKAYEMYLTAYNLANEEPVIEYFVAITSVGLGNMLLKENKYKEAVEYFKKAESYFKKTGNKDNEGVCIVMLGETFFKDSNFVEAEANFQKAAKIFKDSDNQYGLAATYINLGDVSKIKGNSPLAAKYYRAALEINLKRKAWINIKDAALKLSEIFEAMNRPADALANYKTVLQYNDSLISIESNKAIAEAESKYESEKKEQQLQLKNIELEKSQLEIDHRNYLIYGFAVGILIFLVLLFFVYRQYNQKKKANVLLLDKNEEIKHQSSIIEEKNKDITDSINYSKHIQQAILPQSLRVKELLPKSFVVFKPKDIVSGDFYLVEEKNDLIYIAVVDCTGHGVPGAMLSVFANSAIKNIITSNNYDNDPAGILSELCIQFKNNLRGSDTYESINDGVDMGVSIIDRKNKKLYFAGAKNNLMLIRDSVLHDFLANRWGISGSNSPDQLQFTNHVIELTQGDKFYLTTDGFPDQFGGEKGKKFKLKQLKELLVKNSHLGFDEQERVILSEFNTWKGPLAQIDDVTIVGFEV